MKQRAIDRQYSFLAVQISFNSKELSSYVDTQQLSNIGYQGCDSLWHDSNNYILYH